MPLQEPPHFTREMLLGTLHHLRADLDSALTGLATDDRAKSRMDAAQHMGLDKLAQEAITAIDWATESVASLDWPGGLTVRYIAMVGALRAMVSASHALPAGSFAADLKDLERIVAKVERACGKLLRSSKALALKGLYVIVDPTLTRERDPLQITSDVVAGGATAIQLRVKTQDKGRWWSLAKEMQQLCAELGVIFFINDHPDVAVSCGADGVHLGQYDLSVSNVEAILRPWHLVGTSNALISEIAESLRNDVDYVAVGRIFPTKSKSNTRPAGLSTLHAARTLLPNSGPPLIAIGGITVDNAAQIAMAGADCMCVIGAATLASDPRTACIGLLDAFEAGMAKSPRSPI